MKINRFGIFANLVVLIVFSSILYAHPASDVKLTANDKVLTVFSEHAVSNPKEHYIYKISVNLNSKEIITQLLSEQIGNFQTVSYTIPSLKKGDHLEVQTVCNKYGTKKAVLVIN